MPASEVVHADEAGLERAASALAAGQVVAVPTDTVYGLAAHAFDPRACRVLFALKERPDGISLPVLVASIDQAAELVADPSPLARVAHELWPGALTVVVERAGELGLELGGDPATIGLRCPADATVRALCERAGPLATTSANLHGSAPAQRADELTALFDERLAVVVDGGTRAGQPSSVISLVGGTARELRAGPIALEQVQSALRG